MTQYYIILDIETTGLPDDWDAPAEDIDNWPGILEIAWQLYNDKGELFNEESLIIRPDGEKISKEIEELTGITTDYANENGVSQLTALTKFTSVLQKFNPALVAHNCEFDTKVIEAALLKNDIGISLSSYEQICTMKESTEFCDLPNLKYPKLSELYKILFSSSPTSSHRALPDVQATAKSFFKLIELEVIRIKKRKSVTHVDFETLEKRQITNAIDNYISDLNSYPLFYDLKNIHRLFEDRIFDAVKDRFNKYYQTSKAKAFEIPYNQVAHRIVIALNIEDIIIRYIIINHLKEQTNFISSIEKYDEHTVSNLIQKEIENGNPISIKVDINNCYESVNHSKLISEVSKELQLSDSSIFINVLDNALKIVYENEFGKVIKKEQGLLIGSKPDEYLAEFFLDRIENEIKRRGISIIRIADEFIYFADNLSTAREKFTTIQEIVADYNLTINKAKTSINDYRKDTLNQKFDLELVEAAWSGGSIPFKSSSEKFTIRDKQSGVDLNKTYLTGKIRQNNSNDESDKFEEKENKSKPMYEVDSYETAIVFLKYLLNSQQAISEYQKKHPNYKYLYNIVFSQPTDFREDYYNLDIAVFSESNIEKLKKVIYYYPKSEYYTAIAIYLLVFAATNTVHCTDTFDGLDGLSYSLTRTCELGNLTIIELLKSNDIHPYQKYILLRNLFKKNSDLTLDIDSYSIKTVNYYDHNYLNENAEFEFSPTLPFKAEVLEIVGQLASETEYYPLKMICNELNKLMKN